MCLEVSGNFLNTADWRKNPYCNQYREFAPNLPSLGALLFTATSWNTFVDSVK